MNKEKITRVKNQKTGDNEKIQIYEITEKCKLTKEEYNDYVDKTKQCKTCKDSYIVHTELLNLMYHNCSNCINRSFVEDRITKEKKEKSKCDEHKENDTKDKINNKRPIWNEERKNVKDIEEILSELGCEIIYKDEVDKRRRIQTGWNINEPFYFRYKGKDSTNEDMDTS